MKNYFSDKVIFITGGASGIGLSLSNNFIAQNANVYAIGRRTKSELVKENPKIEEVMSENNYVYQQCDVGNISDVRKIYEKIKNESGIPDILINNAGVGIFKSFADTSLDDFDAIMNTNFRGAFNTSKLIVDDYLKIKKGMIVNIISVAVNERFTNSSIYAASKSAMLTMSRIMREELRKDNIKIIDVIPGATATDIWNKKVLEHHSHKMMKADDIANTIICLIESSMNNSLMIEEITIKPQSGNL